MSEPFTAINFGRLSHIERAVFMNVVTNDADGQRCTSSPISWAVNYDAFRRLVDTGHPLGKLILQKLKIALVQAKLGTL